jgi:hypothetical protein
VSEAWLFGYLGVSDLIRSNEQARYFSTAFSVALARCSGVAQSVGILLARVSLERSERPTCFMRSSIA